VLVGVAALAVLIDEIGRVGIWRARERADADADQAKSRRPGLARRLRHAKPSFTCKPNRDKLGKP
jgi:hypothetical protein